jgi:hypothetical protein
VVSLGVGIDSHIQIEFLIIRLLTDGHVQVSTLEIRVEYHRARVFLLHNLRVHTVKPFFITLFLIYSSFLHFLTLLDCLENIVIGGHLEVI